MTRAPSSRHPRARHPRPRIARTTGGWYLPLTEKTHVVALPILRLVKEAIR